MGTSKTAVTRIGFIGGGNMAEALVRGLLEARVAGAEDVRVAEPDRGKRERLHERYGVVATEDSDVVAGWAELLVLAVKPSVVPRALAAVGPFVAPETLLVSVAAGVPTHALEAHLPTGRRVVRAMPNTAAIVGAGATAIAKGSAATDLDLARAQALFEAVGCCVVVPEKQLDAVTGLSGSGPAYVMVMIEALADGGVRAGLPREIAQLLAAQTVFGAAKLQLETGEHPAVLKDRVTSPGGTTSAGLAALEGGGVRSAFSEAVVAATRRSEELGR